MTQSVETEEIWEDLHHRLLAFIRGRVSNPQDAQDILQEVFIRIHENVGRLNDAQSVTGWAYRITRNAIVDHYRARAKDTEGRTRLAKAAESDEEIANLVGDDDRARRELAGCLEPLMRSLPQHYSQAIELTELRGLTQKDAAEQVGLSVPGMKARVQRGRRKLREALLDCCRVEVDRRGGVVDYEPKGGDSCGNCGCDDGRSPAEKRVQTEGQSLRDQ